MNFGIIIVVIGICIVLFIILREFWCWYWKINERRNISYTIKEKINKIETSNSFDGSDLLRVLNKIDGKLDEISELLKNQSENKKKTDGKKSVKQENEIVQKEEKEYALYHTNGRVFARNGYGLYCPDCHAAIDSETSTMCPSCGKSLME